MSGSIGQSVRRVDAYDKVTGAARYAGDLEPRGVLVAKVVHATVANGLVTGFDLEAARKVEGVVDIVTCFDVPEIDFPTAGHPWSVEAAHQDVCDRRILNRRVRVWGDDVAAVVARDEVSATRAARLVKVFYDEYPPLLDVDDAMADGAGLIHDDRPGNVLAHSAFAVGDERFEDVWREGGGLMRLDAVYDTQAVQHCHIEPAHSFAYMEDDRIVVVASTQIPHIMRRVIGQALGLPWSRVRVVKPYIGGGFGNKQDVLYEPLNALLTLRLGGRPVKIELTREETMACTRVRHPIRFHVRALADGSGRLVARSVAAFSNQGGYASHGHAIVANAINEFKQIYQPGRAMEAEAYTVYTNRTTGGAMRGYGIPQGCFASECMADDLARMAGVDPVDFRLLNCVREGYADPHTHIAFHSYGLRACIERGRERFGWDEKRRRYANQTGDVRRGVGVAIFCYKTGVYPISLETASCRMTLNQDGSMMLSMGATEIGQGADTVFAQMASACTGITLGRVHVVSSQDTDVAPFDTGAYASRQTYIGGMAIKETGAAFKLALLDYAAYMLGRDRSALDVESDRVVDAATREALLPLEKLAMEAQYSLDRAGHISAETSVHCKDNTFASGACFAEVEVDIPLGRVRVTRLLNVHDSGVLINPALAAAQVHGGMGMGLGYGLFEELLYDKNGRPLNDNLLDYKLPTTMDMPDLEADFVQLEDPTGPFGNKALGEPPNVPPAAAIRNAVLHATGVAINSLPLSPQKLVTAFTKAGLIEEVEAHV